MSATKYPLTMARIHQRAAAIMAAQDRAAHVEAITTAEGGPYMVRTYRESTPEPTEEQPTERWTHATHHSLGNGCYQSRKQGGAQ